MDDQDAENAADFEMKEIDKQGHNQKLQCTGSEELTSHEVLQDFCKRCLGGVLVWSFQTWRPLPKDIWSKLVVRHDLREQPKLRGLWCLCYDKISQPDL